LSPVSFAFRSLAQPIRPATRRSALVGDRRPAGNPSAASLLSLPGLLATDLLRTTPNLRRALRPRTLRLNEALRLIGLAAGGEGGARYLNPAYAYYSLRWPTLIARPPTIPAFSGTLLLHAPAVPDFNTVPLPYELVDDAQEILWGMAAPFLTAK